MVRLIMLPGFFFPLHNCASSDIPILSLCWQTGDFLDVAILT